MLEEIIEKNKTFGLGSPQATRTVPKARKSHNYDGHLGEWLQWLQRHLKLLLVPGCKFKTTLPEVIMPMKKSDTKKKKKFFVFT